MNVDLALRNSQHWYEAVLRAHGIDLALEADYWSTEAPTPPYYSSFATRTADTGTPAQLARLRELATTLQGQAWGIKDSFAHLPQAELDSLGLRHLFDATWYGLAPGAGALGDASDDVTLETVTGPDALEAWERTWQVTSPAPGMRVFPPAVLEAEGVTFLAACQGSDLVGGAAINLSEGAVGVSNVFALPGVPVDALQRACLRWVRDRHEDLPIVGYGALGAGGDLEALERIGFERLGPLRVWVTRPA